MIIGKQTIKRLKVLHECIGVSFGSVGLEAIRFTNKSKKNKVKLILTNFLKVEPLKSLAQLNVN